MNTDFLIQVIRQNLSPDLLKPAFRKNWTAENPTYGHCYVATETLYHLLGGKKSGWKPCVGKDEAGNCHWWLQNEAGERLDVTDEQYLYKAQKPPYEKGRGCGFLTKQPSKRAQILIQRANRMLYAQ
jgi:hypothetical protein